MTTQGEFHNKTVLVLGYAKTGASVVNYLLQEHANIILNDRGDLSQDPSVSCLVEAGVKVVDGGHPISLLEGVDLIVKNPGIPYSIDLLVEAQARQIPIWTDIELAYRLSMAPIIAVTGSNGKTTTTSLIQAILNDYLQAKGRQAYLAGNIGIPALEMAAKAQAEDRLIMEVSSFQLMGTQTFRPKIAVYTNIYSAHLDYHGSQEAYEEAKLQLQANLTSEDFLVFNGDQDHLVDLLSACPAKKYPITMKDLPEPAKGQACIFQEAFYFDGEKVAPVSCLKLPGDHNLQNALAAIAVAKLEGVPNDLIEKTLSQFQGIVHRIQPLGTFEGVSYFNDSKATNTTATITALKSFEHDVVYIGGGLDRGNDFKDLIPYLKPVKSAFLYGQSANKMAKDFELAGIKQIEVLEDLKQAFEQASRSLEKGDTVLLSPACASWDQFDSFETRGQVFMDLVKEFTSKNI